MEDVIYYGHKVSFTAVWYITRSFDIFSKVLVVVPRKIWQPWSYRGKKIRDRLRDRFGYQPTNLPSTGHGRGERSYFVLYLLGIQMLLPNKCHNLCAT
jgi:hypothetical protein